ncbi:diguanylate cyclase [Pseudomonas solani]|uniref:diguanylate cyclase n=1 Tax=Pseudomonas solani TaxID=2731552 RepID=UPI003F4AEA2B
MKTATRLQAGFLLAIGMLVLNIVLPLATTRWVGNAERQLELHEHTGRELSNLLSSLKDGETGQRGFALTGRDDYLTPLYQGYGDVDKDMARFKVTLANDELLDDLQRLVGLLAEQRAFFGRVIELRRSEGLAAAGDLVSTGKGKQLMDAIRLRLGEMQGVVEQRVLLAKQEIEWRGWVGMAMLGLVTLLDLLVIALLFHFTFRMLRAGREARLAQDLLSEQLSLGMQRVELRNHQISLLSRMAGALHSVNEFDECFGIITRFAAQLFPQSDGCLSLYHPSRDVLEEAGHWGGWQVGSVELFEPDDCWAIRRGQSHLVLDVNKDLVCPHLHECPLAANGSLCVPLMAQGEPLGVMTLCGGSADLELAEAFAEQVSLGVANLSLRESLRQQSVVDALTGLHNRRFLDETLRRELLRASRKQSPVIVVLLDVDHFKRFNDTFGHEAGDLVLRHLALEMKRHVRSSDLACRYGGEEFALVMPEISLEDAMERCEALRLGVTRLQIRYGGQPLGPIAISLGLACFPADGESADVLLHAADSALYQAKRAGRNQLCLYQGIRGQHSIAAESQAP